MAEVIKVEVEDVDEPPESLALALPLPLPPLQPPQKRPLEQSSTAIVPSKTPRHAGMFRERTIQLVSLLVERVRNAQAADVEELGEALEELADCVVDETVLLKTGVGKEVAKLQKHADESIAASAKALVTQWKRDRDSRQKVMLHFQDKAQLTLKASRRLEEGLFNFACPMGFATVEDKREYQRHFMRISTHLKDPAPTALLQRLRDGALAPEDVAFMPDEELLSVERREQLEADRREGLKAAVAAASTEPAGTETSEYMCPRCQSSRCAYREMQTGWHNDQQDMTILVSCLECGERWKASDDHGLGA